MKLKDLVLRENNDPMFRSLENRVRYYAQALGKMHKANLRTVKWGPREQDGESPDDMAHIWYAHTFNIWYQPHTPYQQKQELKKAALDLEHSMSAFHDYAEGHHYPVELWKKSWEAYVDPADRADYVDPPEHV